MAESSPAPLAILRRPQVQARCGLSRSAIYRRLANNTFPQPVPLGEGRAVGWLAHEVDAFIASCIAKRDAEGGAK